MLYRCLHLAFLIGFFIGTRKRILSSLLLMQECRAMEASLAL